MKKNFYYLGWLFFFITTIIAIIANIFLNAYYYNLGFKDGLAQTSQNLNPKLAKNNHKETINIPNYSIQGKITLINNKDKAIIIKTFPLIVKNTQRTIPEDRIIEINNDTQIIKTFIKDKNLYQKELEEYRQMLQKNPKNKITLPTKFYEKEISLEDLKKGDIITVISDKDITYKERILAKTIKTNSASSIKQTSAFIPTKTINPKLFQPAP